MQKRSVGLSIVLSIITCGIYGLYWQYMIANDVNTVSGHTSDTSGGFVILFSILTCGIYNLYWLYQCGVKLDETAENHGGSKKQSALLYLILGIFGLSIISIAIIQSELNNYITEN